MKILLLGSTGLLGSSIKRFFEENRNYKLGINLTNPENKKSDLSVKQNLFNLANFFQPDLIINTVALTNVDFCEINPNKAFLINARLVDNISQWINNHSPQTHLIHISTDHVYDSNECHTENNIKLTNYYAFSKYIGEMYAEKCQATVLRTNFFGLGLHPTRLSFTDWIYNSIKNNQNVDLLNDIFFNPVSLETLISIIDLCVEKKPIGIFNLGSNGLMSKAEFAIFFANNVGLPTNLFKEKSTKEVNFFNAYRPKNMHMNSEKLMKILNMTIPSLKDEIINVSDLYKNFNS